MNTDGELNRTDLNGRVSDSLATHITVFWPACGQTSTGAARHNHYLAPLTILARFLIVLAEEWAKSVAPNLFG